MVSATAVADLFAQVLFPSPPAENPVGPRGLLVAGGGALACIVVFAVVLLVRRRMWGADGPTARQKQLLDRAYLLLFFLGVLAVCAFLINSLQVTPLARTAALAVLALAAIAIVVSWRWDGHNERR